MPEPPRLPMTVAITTAIALIEQFTSSLSPEAYHDIPAPAPTTPSPLLLLSTAAKSLKAQVTKLSLLTLTTPFTPTAVSAPLQSINDSVLPSLVTATLLTTDDLYTTSFANEVNGLTRGALSDLLVLIRLVEARSKDSKPTTAFSDDKKQDVTEATGRVWGDCDAIVKFAEDGLPGFVVRMAKQWLELMKDAVKELQEWDPEDDAGDDPFGLAGSDDENDDEADGKGHVEKGEDDRATISAGVRDQALRVLSRIPQSVHVMVKQRLEKLRKPKEEDMSSDTRAVLDLILVRTRKVSELMDESAEGMYMGDLELCLKKAGEARALTIDIVESVKHPFGSNAVATDRIEQSAEDKYVNRALEWIRQVDTAAGEGKE